MARRLFLLPHVDPSASVRVDTASGSDSAADIINAQGQPISGAVLRADQSGRLPAIYGPDGVSTLYVKTLTYSGAVAAVVATITGADLVPAGSPGAYAPITGSTSYVTVVEHGATAGTARPAGAVRVFWRGSVAPTNAVQYDRWINSGVTPYTESIYTGSAWTALGGPTTAQAIGYALVFGGN